MKVNYNGYEIEGTVEEIQELVGERQYKARNIGPEDFGWEKIDKRKARDETDMRRHWTLKEERKLRKLGLGKRLKSWEIAMELGKTEEQVKNKLKYMKLSDDSPGKSKGIMLTMEQKKYILTAKKNNISFINLVLRFNNKFGSNYTKNEIKNKYYEIKGK